MALGDEAAADGDLADVGWPVLLASSRISQSWSSSMKPRSTSTWPRRALAAAGGAVCAGGGLLGRAGAGFALVGALAGLPAGGFGPGAAGQGAPATPQLPPFRTARSQFAAAFGTDDEDQLTAVLDRLRFDPARHRIGCPVLVLHGGADPLVPEPGIQAPFAEAAGPRWTAAQLAHGEHRAIGAGGRGGSSRRRAGGWLGWVPGAGERRAGWPGGAGTWRSLPGPGIRMVLVAW